ncbi:MAG: DUF547 domain-containing protein, partial [Bacteroidota bacterium]
MKHLIVLFTVVLANFFYGSAQDLSNFLSGTDALFGTYVKDGRVDYKALKEDSSALEALVGLAEGISVSKENPKDYQAFWINGYNLQVIKGIVDNYPVKSPLDIPGFFDTTKRNIGGKQITLNDIENKLLRGHFPTEPRFHFVLVCA